MIALKPGANLALINGKGAEESLETWNDPEGMFKDATDLDLKEFLLNKSIDIFDHTGARVHPRDYEKVFQEGSYVVADATLQL